jgi:hypothetical protein
MRLIRLAAALVISACNGFAAAATVPPALLTQPEPAAGPFWSFDLNGSYVFGSRIQKAHHFGSQTEYHRNGPTDDPRTNNAILEYSEDRAGTGISYNPRKGVSFEASAGWSIQRRFNYFRAGPDYSSKGAPYLKLDLSIDLF